MPSASRNQAIAAGIAHAAEKGTFPKSKLRGASKQMYKGMHGKGELRKFAKTKHKGLPRHVESLTSIQQRVKPLAAQIVEDMLNNED